MDQLLQGDPQYFKGTAFHIRTNGCQHDYQQNFIVTYQRQDGSVWSFLEQQCWRVAEQAWNKYDKEEFFVEYTSTIAIAIAIVDESIRLPVKSFRTTTNG